MDILIIEIKLGHLKRISDPIKFHGGVSGWRNYQQQRKVEECWPLKPSTSWKPFLSILSDPLRDRFQDQVLLRFKGSTPAPLGPGFPVFVEVVY